MTALTTSAPLHRVLEPITNCLTRDVAERVVNARLTEGLQDRLDELARKANEGQLSSSERTEYEEYVEAIDLVGIFKAQARLALQRLKS